MEIIEGPLSKSCLVVFLRSRLRLGIAAPWPLSGLEAAGVRYTPMPFGDGLGFYDWLRDRDRKVLGVRLWPFDLAYPTLAECKHLEYIEVEPDKNVAIYFVPEAQVVPAFSCDQDFLYSALFRSQGDDIAIAFGLENLNARELGSLSALGVDWEPVRAG